MLGKISDSSLLHLQYRVIALLQSFSLIPASRAPPQTNARLSGQLLEAQCRATTAESAVEAREAVRRSLAEELSVLVSRLGDEESRAREGAAAASERDLLRVRLAELMEQVRAS